MSCTKNEKCRRSVPKRTKNTERRERETGRAKCCARKTVPSQRRMPPHERATTYYYQYACARTKATNNKTATSKSAP